MLPHSVAGQTLQRVNQLLEPRQALLERRQVLVVKRHEKLQDVPEQQCNGSE